MTDNIVEAVFSGRRSARTRAVYQYDYGMVLKPIGLELPATYEVHFGASATGPTTTQLGNADGVNIPDAYLQSGSSVYAYIYLHSGEDDGETVYSIVIPVIARGQITDEQPTPVQQDVITQAIAALNSGVETVQEITEDIPQTIEDALTEAKESGEFDGPQGPQGEPGQAGSTGPAGSPGSPGADGFSPTATVTQTSSGATISITDKDGTTTADISNGQTGPQGPQGVPGQDGVGVPAGGTAGQVLAKVSGTDYDTEWTTPDPGGVTDVQVNGTSVVTDGVANINRADGSNLGLIIVGTGLSIGSTGILRPSGGSANDRKAGTNNYIPTVMSTQHESVFYGLAKAAGADMASSSNPVGTYTDAAKDKIQTMLGIDALIGTHEGATASSAKASGDVFIYNGKLYKATTAISSGAAIVPGTNCTQTTIIDILRGA